MSLRDFKVPDFKFPKFKMNNIEKIDDLTEEVKKKGKQKEYKPGDPIPPAIRYNTMQEVFEDVTVKFKDNVLITQKFDHKGKYEDKKVRTTVIGGFTYKNKNKKRNMKIIIIFFIIKH